MRPSATRRSSKSSSMATTLRSFLLPWQPDHPSPRPLARPRSPDGVPSRRWTSCVALRVATVRRLCPRPQGFLPPGSSLRMHRVAAMHRSMLPWALDRHDPMPATRGARRTANAARCTWRHQTAPGVPSPERDEKAKILGFVWLRAGPMLASDLRSEDRRSAARQAGSLGSPKTAALPSRPVRLPREPDQDRSQR